MTKSISPLLKQENRKSFIEQAMKSMSDRQDEVIKQADIIIGDVVKERVGLGAVYSKLNTI